MAKIKKETHLDISLLIWLVSFTGASFSFVSISIISPRYAIFYIALF